VHPLPQFQVTLGAFNGNGGNQSGNNDRRLLFVARSTAHSSFSDSVDLYVGLSFAYRDKDGMTLKKICGTLVPFWGKDARWGGEGRLSSSVWSVQAEYIEAHLEAEKTLGYYVLGSVFIDETNEMTGLVEQFRDIDPNTSDAAWYSAGWNHYFSGSEEPKLATARTGDSVQDSSEN
jgi:phosphate-selective porin